MIARLPPVGPARPANGYNRRDRTVRHEVGEGRQSTLSGQSLAIRRTAAVDPSRPTSIRGFGVSTPIEHLDVQDGRRPFVDSPSKPARSLIPDPVRRLHATLHVRAASGGRLQPGQAGRPLGTLGPCCPAPFGACTLYTFRDDRPSWRPRGGCFEPAICKVPRAENQYFDGSASAMERIREKCRSSTRGRPTTGRPTPPPVQVPRPGRPSITLRIDLGGSDARPPAGPNTPRSVMPARPASSGQPARAARMAVVLLLLLGGAGLGTFLGH
jgi:hypothetical protein